MFFIGTAIILIIILFFYKNKDVDKKTIDNHDPRKEVIAEKVESLGGAVRKVERIKNRFSPFNDEFDGEDGSMYFTYKVEYMVDVNIYEGWAIYQMRPTLYGYEMSWIWIF